MTSEELADILAKANAVPALKQTFDTSYAAYNPAITNAQNAKAAWLSAVDSDADDTTLTSLATQYVATAVAEHNALVIMQASSGPRQAASAELESALQAVIQGALNPPP